MFHIACLISVGKGGDEFEEVEIVHENWVTQDRKSCHFPPFLRNQLKKALKKAMPPSSDWKMYEMKILNSYGTYDEALSVAELMSKLDSSDDEMPRKKQKISENKKSHNNLQKIECALTLNKNLSSSAVDADEDWHNSNSPIERSRDIDNLLQMTQNNSNKSIHNVAKTSDEPILLKLSSNAPQNSSFINTITLTPSLQRNNLVSSSSYNVSHSKTNHLVTSSNNRSSLLNCEAFPSSQSLPTSSSKKIMEIPSQKKVLIWMEEMDERLKKIDQDNARILASLTTNSNKDCENCIRNRSLRDQNEFADLEQYLTDDDNSRKKMDSVQSFLKDCFNNQPDELYENVFKAVSEAGVETFEDLKYLDTEKDLVGILKPIQARKLKAKFNETFSSDVQSYESRFEPAAVPTPKTKKYISKSKGLTYENFTTSLTSEILPEPDINACSDEVNSLNTLALASGSGKNYQKQRHLDNWAHHYKIPYKKFPSETLKKLEKGLRLDQKERRHVLRVLSFEIANITKRPGSKNLEIIVSKMVSDYASSLQDEIGGEQIGSGYATWLRSLVVRFENLNRIKGNSLKRQLTQQGPKLRKKNANIQPDKFPKNETAEMQEERRCWLKKEYIKKERNLKEAQNAMYLTFASQRLCINSCDQIDFVLKEWPFLQDVSFILNHFNQLMAPYKVDWDIVFEKKIPEVRSFLKANFVAMYTDEIKETLSLLLKYFREDNDLFKVYKEFLTADDVEKDETCPVTPFMAFFGETDTAIVLIDRRRISSYLRKTEAFKMWFVSFCVFNICYPEKCLSTMGFIQRALLGITTDDKMKKCVLDKILKLITQLINFKSI